MECRNNDRYGMNLEKNERKKNKKRNGKLCEKFDLIQGLIFFVVVVLFLRTNSG